MKIDGGYSFITVVFRSLTLIPSKKLSSASCLSVFQQRHETDRQARRHCYHVSHLADDEAKAQKLWLAQGHITANGAGNLAFWCWSGPPPRMPYPFCQSPGQPPMPLNPTQAFSSLSPCLCISPTVAAAPPSCLQPLSDSAL